MQVTHSKVSGIPNPGDPTIVGGEDWDDPHTITGWVFLGAVTVAKSAGSPATVNGYVGIATPAVYDYDDNHIWLTVNELSVPITDWYAQADAVTYNSSFGGFMHHRVTSQGDGSNGFHFCVETVGINPNGTENYGPDYFYVNVLLFKKM